MTSQREWEKRIWSGLHDKFTEANHYQDILPNVSPGFVNWLPLGDRERLHKAWIKVRTRLQQLSS